MENGPESRYLGWKCWMYAHRFVDFKWGRFREGQRFTRGRWDWKFFPFRDITTSSDRRSKATFDSFYLIWYLPFVQVRLAQVSCGIVAGFLLLHLHLHHPPQHWRLWPLDLEKYCGLDGQSLGYLHPSSFGIMRENATHLEKSPNVSGKGAQGM